MERELRYIALSDPTALFDRATKGGRSFTLKALHAMAPETRRCIASVKLRTKNETDSDRAQDEIVEVRLWDKLKALEMCGRTLGLFRDRVELTTSESMISRVDAGKARAAAGKSNG